MTRAYLLSLSQDNLTEEFVRAQLDVHSRVLLSDNVVQSR